jgi:hypothetical protein
MTVKCWKRLTGSLPHYIESFLHRGVSAPVVSGLGGSDHLALLAEGDAR